MKVFPFKYILVVSAITSMTLACGLFTPKPSSTSEPPSLPALPSIPGVTGDASLVKDDFSDSGSGWGTGTDSNSSVDYVDGGLHMEGFRDNYFTWSNPDQETYQDVHMEVTVKNETADTRAGFGVMCNQQTTDSSYYYFAVSADGTYVIGKAEVGKDDVYLTNNNKWGTSDLIARDADSYRIGADCGGGTLTLYVDGKKIDSVTDSSYQDGAVGLFLWTGDKTSASVTYDDFVMTSLK
jgi:hypothetical protein